jgi:electron transport complex protein RnfG
MSDLTKPLPDMQQEAEPSSFRLIATLGVAGFLSGLILVSIYLVTKPIIAHNKAEALKAAIFEVLPGTETFKTLVPDGEGLREVAEGEKAEVEAVYLGFAGDGTMTGFAISGAETGYADVIEALFSYNPTDTIIIGFKVLDSKETPGLGDKIFKDAAFQTNFTALKVTPEIIPVKIGEKKTANEVEAITGATISSKAIVRLLNASITKWKQPIENYMKTNNPNTTANE